MYIVKLHRQHSSVVMTIPKKVCEQMGVCAGDYVSITDLQYESGVTLQRCCPGEKNNVRDNRNTDKRNQGGRA